MTIIKCDKCGKQVNTPYCNPEIGEHENRRPCRIEAIEGSDETNCNSLINFKDISYELCRSCFEKFKEELEKFMAERKTS